MKKITASATCLSLALLFAGQVQAEGWGYGEANGPEHWGEVAPLCATGVNQSPINITKATQANLLPLRIDYQGKVTQLVNNGHTIEALVSGKNDVIINGDTYHLKQFHFHTPSENLIDGKQYPLEAHFVNADDKGKLAVISVMFEIGPRTNSDLDALLNEIPEKGQTIEIKQDLTPGALLPRDREYYQFNGSLTTPPCTEGVRWYVMQEHQTSSKEQTEMLHAVMGNNNRPTQPLNARVILDE